MKNQYFPARLAECFDHGLAGELSAAEVVRSNVTGDLGVFGKRIGDPT